MRIRAAVERVWDVVREVEFSILILKINKLNSDAEERSFFGIVKLTPDNSRNIWAQALELEITELKMIRNFWKEVLNAMTRTVGWLILHFFLYMGGNLIPTSIFPYLLLNNFN